MVVVYCPHIVSPNCSLGIMHEMIENESDIENTS